MWGINRDCPIHRIVVHAFSEDEAKELALVDFKSQYFAEQKLNKVNNPILPKIERVEVLWGIHTDPKKRQQSLFEDFADACLGFKLEDVQGACVNMLLTSVQKRYVTLEDAEARWDELMGRGKIAMRRRFLKLVDERDPKVAHELGNRLVG